MMKGNDQPKGDGEKPVEMTLYKSEDQIFQKLHLCEYLGELYEATEKVNEHLI